MKKTKLCQETFFWVENFFWSKTFVEPNLFFFENFFGSEKNFGQKLFSFCLIQFFTSSVWVFLILLTFQFTNRQTFKKIKGPTQKPNEWRQTTNLLLPTTMLKTLYFFTDFCLSRFLR